MLFTTPDKSQNDVILKFHNYIFDKLKGQNTTEDEEFINYVSDQFLLEDDYTISAFLSQFFLYDGDQDHSAIIYPSVRNKKSFNIAINKNVVDNFDYFEFEKGIELNLHNFNFDPNTGEGNMKYQILSEFHLLNKFDFDRIETKGEITEENIVDFNNLIYSSTSQT